MWCTWLYVMVECGGGSCIKIIIKLCEGGGCNYVVVAHFVPSSG